MVRVVLASGGQRTVDTADGAHMSGPFFVITRQHPGGRVDTVLTLRTQDVVRAEIVKDGAIVDHVLGGAQSAE